LSWNWCNLLVFNIANQRLPDSVIEDQINKPWRPMPSGRLSSDEARQLLLSVLVLSLVTISLIGAFEDALWMIALTWIYNDLGGADVSTMSPSVAISAINSDLTALSHTQSPPKYCLGLSCSGLNHCRCRTSSYPELWISCLVWYHRRHRINLNSNARPRGHGRRR
jgi:hypothetical protein